MDKILQSKKFKITMGIIGGFIIIFLAFGAGTFVGMRRANFSFRWAENYQRNFGEPHFNAHGIFGQIIKTDGSTLVINGRDNIEKIILITASTTINSFRGDLRVNDNVVIIGNPNNAGQIEARLIRLMPASPAGGPMMQR